jgi:MFS family permease
MTSGVRMDTSQAAPSTGWKRILRSLHHRNFRLFFAGQGISLIGTWMQQVAMGWLVYDTTRDAQKMGLVSFSSQVPSLVIVPLVGVFLDRWNRHRVVVATQALAMLQAGVLTALVVAGVIELWHIILLSIFVGCINAVDMPARQAFLPDLLESKEDLANAIALNSSLFNGARLVGPSLAGFMIAYVGMALCFFVNALSYVAVILALLAMTIPARPSLGPRQHVLHGLREGFSYCFGFAPIRSLILLTATVSFVGIPYTVLLPLFTQENLLGGGAVTFGFLLTASGGGALVGAIYMASRPSVLGLGPRITAAAALFSVALMGFSAAVQLHLLFVSLILLVATGLGMMVTMAGCNTILQTIVDDDKRGRAMSIYTMAFMGVSPFGCLLAGWLASAIGAPATVLLCGAGSLVGTLIFALRLPALRALVRPLYIQKGILSAPTADVVPLAEMLVPAKE